MQKNQPTKGYVIVASMDENFYSLAINLAESILDFYPEAKITLFTEERFVDSRAEQLDNVFFCDDHYRAKLYGIANSPYDITMYIDADAVCDHEDISTAFDLLDGNDMVFTPINKVNEWTFQSRYLNPDREDEDYAFKLHGAICLFDSRNPLVKEFMCDWWEYYQKQFDDTWWPSNDKGEWDTETYDRGRLKMWDQFTLWYLTNKEEKYQSLKIGIFEDWVRWNYQFQYDFKESMRIDNPIIRHMSAHCQKWRDESYSEVGLLEL